jgi:hypothetical protein
MNASNFLNIDELLHLTSAKLASMINDNPPSEILKMFGRTEEFTLKEEEAIRQKYKFNENGEPVNIKNT